jgi:hypothetical protein
VQQCRHLGEVAGKRLSGFGAQLDPIASAECETTKAMPFGSNCQPGSIGRSSTSRASIGDVSGGSGNIVQLVVIVRTVAYSYALVIRAKAGTQTAVGPDLRRDDETL